MPFVNFSIGDLATIPRKPSYFLPIFLLVLQEDSLVVQILSYFNDDVLRLVNFASDVERFDGICYISNSISLSFPILYRQPCIFVVLINWQKMNSTLRQLIKYRGGSPVAFLEVCQLWIILISCQFDIVVGNLELQPE
jgi:hypothetical protein